MQVEVRVEHGHGRRLEEEDELDPDQMLEREVPAHPLDHRNELVGRPGATAVTVRRDEAVAAYHVFAVEPGAVGLLGVPLVGRAALLIGAQVLASGIVAVVDHGVLVSRQHVEPAYGPEGGGDAAALPMTAETGRVRLYVLFSVAGRVGRLAADHRRRLVAVNGGSIVRRMLVLAVMLLMVVMVADRRWHPTCGRRRRKCPQIRSAG